VSTIAFCECKSLLIFFFVSFYYSEVSGDREVQRTMLELLNQLDGFSSDERIKVSIQPQTYLLLLS
jgi:hypothetical protein